MSFYNEPWDRPYLTPSIAVTLLTKTPYHAKLACPFYGTGEDSSTAAMNEGRVVDCLVLGGDPGVTVLDVADYRKKEAKNLRDNSVNPMKIADYERCAIAARDVLTKIRSQSEEAESALVCGQKKKRLFWDADGVHCSTEPDIWYQDAVYDLKRTKIAPTAHNWRRHASSMYYHIQVAATLEATGAATFKWIIVEADPPHCAVIHTASPLFIAVGQRDWEYAKQVWRNCVESDCFPAYESDEIDPASWLIERGEEEENFA